MKIYLSANYLKAHKKIVKKNPQLNKTIKNKLQVFLKNPNHPSLKLHKLKGKKIDLWSLTIKPDLKIIFIYYKNSEIILTDIGSHNQVY
jgi:addiction module RelE/StbE family toxin